jgi:glucokinase
MAASVFKNPVVHADPTASNADFQVRHIEGKHVMTKTILAADIGGTNSRFAWFQTDGPEDLEMKGKLWLPTKEAESFAQLLSQLRGSGFALAPERADMVVIAAAGPVEKGCYCAPPYIDWEIDLLKPDISDLLQRAVLINDFVAQAYACKSPIGDAARCMLPGEAVSDGTIGVLGAGTALGKAILVPLPGGGFHALPSEGGHAYFPFLTDREVAYQRFYQENSGERHIVANLIVSGRGLSFLHWFLTGERRTPEEVSAHGLDPESETLAWAARFYGRLCRDFALDVLASGGLYIAGGVAARNPGILLHEAFRREFQDSPTMGRLLAEIPVFLVDNMDSGLWGAGFLGRQLLYR